MRKFQDDPTIDGSLNKPLVRAILEHVAQASQLFNNDKAERKLDMFERTKAEEVFLHYMYLTQAKFIDGYCDVQTGKVTARWVTREGHELLSMLTEKSGGFF